MELGIKSIIYQAIIEDRWLDISYVNRENQNTDFYIGIIDLDINRGTITCDIFNPYKDNVCLQSESKKQTFINIEGIKHAKVLEQSYYPIPEDLKKRIEGEPDLAKYLEVDTLDNNILRYLSDCYRLDNDPYLRETVMINGVDRHELHKNLLYKLDDEQFNILLNQVFKKNSKYEAEKINRFSELAINYFSIDILGKQYVVAYRKLALNFKNRTLKMDGRTTINKSFLIEEEKKVTLGMYLDMNPDEFCREFDEKAREYIELIKQNFHNGETVNTRPTIFLVSRNILRGVDVAFESISEMDREGKLTQPLKSFFGRNRSGTGTSKEPNIVVFNKDKINIDQMRVVYNSMVNHVTYVKGPPGTGKTETIFNVLLSAYANDKTVLVCSNNNHPVNDIFEKMTKSLVRKVGKEKTEEHILFPIMRLGNNDEMKETLNKLRAILEFADEHRDLRTNDEYTNRNKDRALSGFKELRDLLKKYEDRQELEDKVSKLEKIKTLTDIKVVSDEIEKQMKLQKEKLESSLVVNEEDVTKYAISASEDVSFQNFVYYSSLAKIKKILMPSNKDLREIIAIDDPDEAVYKFNRFLKDDKNLKRFIDIFPIIVCTNLSSDKLGDPKPHFDLCIMDEAGQCNVASSLVPIVRANDLLLVGDTNQLQPVTVIETDVNDYLMDKYNIKPDYDYVHNSILSTMLRKDNNSKSILLRYHYRCGKRIANFVNQRFYEQQLKLLNKNEGSFTYVDVHNTFNPDSRNAYEAEARAVVDIIKKYHYHDVGIITPFVNQSALINRYLVENGINDIKAGTIHTLQGSEKSVIIMSAALSLKTSQKTMDWIKNNHELINVAVTRAKEQLIFVGDKNAIDALSGKEDNDIKVLSEYVYKNGEIVPPKSDVAISSDFSNNSQSEKDFFVTITPYFNRRGTKMRIERNVPVKDAIRGINLGDYANIGQKEFDVIVQVKEGFLTKTYRTIVVFEIDGGEHIGSSATAARDRIKENICRNYGIKLIRIANNQVKDYEVIISLFECFIKKIPDMEEVGAQLSLFDDLAENDTLAEPLKNEEAEETVDNDNEEPSFDQKRDRLASIISVLEKCDESFLDNNVRFELVGSVRGQRAFERMGILTYRDLLKWDLEKLLSFHSFGRQTIRALEKTMYLQLDQAKHGQGSAELRKRLIERINSLFTGPTSKIEPNQYFIKNLITNLNQCLCSVLIGNCTRRKIEVFKDRLIAGLTLEQIGDKYGLSRERIRQILQSLVSILEIHFSEERPIDNSVNAYYRYLLTIPDKEFFNAIAQIQRSSPIHRTVLKKVFADSNVVFGAVAF